MRSSLAACAALIATLCSQAVLAQQPNAGTPPAKLVPGFSSVDVGGGSLRYMCAGNGSPTVIVEQGAGISVETVFSWDKKYGWAHILPKVQRITRMCVYDRAGLGHSYKLTGPRTSVDSAHDLHTLLDRAGIAPPYVLAGQSLGGINARAFASEYPETVLGMVLIDSATPDQQDRIAKVLPPRSPDESAVLQGFRDGPDRSMLNGEWYDFKANAELTHTLGDLGNMPLIVLTRSPQWQGQSVLPKEWDRLIEPVWQAMQVELTKLSTNSEQRIAKRAGHNIQLEEPDLVIDAIVEVVNEVRGGAKR